jgi:hypothetical protein
VGVEVERDRQQQRLPLPQPGQRLQLARLGRKEVSGQLVQVQAEGGRSVPGEGPLAGGLGAEQMDDRQAPPARLLQPAADPLDRGLLGGGQLAGPLGRLHGREQRGQAVVEVVEALEEVDHALVGAQRAGGERLGTGLVDLQQPPGAQGPLRGKRVPGGLVEQGQRQPEGRVRALGHSLGAGAQGRNPCVQLRRRAQQQDGLLEGR